MAEEIQNTETQVTQEPAANQIYLDEIARLKSLVTEKENEVATHAANERNLFQQIRDGYSNAPAQEEPEVKVDIDGLCHELFEGQGFQGSDIDYVKKILENRKAIIDQKGKDTALPFGHDVSLTAADYERANRVCDGLQQLVDEAEGDSEAFHLALSNMLNGRR